MYKVFRISSTCSSVILVFTLFETFEAVVATLFLVETAVSFNLGTAFSLVNFLASSYFSLASSSVFLVNFFKKF